MSNDLILWSLFLWCHSASLVIRKRQSYLSRSNVMDSISIHKVLYLCLFAFGFCAGCRQESETADIPRVQFSDGFGSSLGQDAPIASPKGAVASNSDGPVADVQDQLANTNSGQKPVDYVQLEKKINSAEALAAKGDFKRAAELAVEVAGESIPDPIMPLMKAFDWYLRDLDLRMAEQVCVLAIQGDPSDPRPRRALAQLLNAEGRRYEASQQVKDLIRLGAAFHREILSLIDWSGPFDLVSFSEILGDGEGSLIELGIARRRFVADAKPEEALVILEKLSRVNPHPAVAALQGRILAEQVELERLVQWASELPEGTTEQPEYWLAVGLWCVHQQKDREAVRALAESLVRDPTNRRAIRALAATLGRLGETELARKTQETLGILDSIFREASSADAAQCMKIATEFHQLQRLWESVVWFRQSFELAGVLEQRADELNARVGQIRKWESQYEPMSLGKVRLEKMFGFQIQDYPEVELAELSSMKINQRQMKEVSESGSSDQRQIRFQDVAADLNLKTSFISEYPLNHVDFWLYQANGGGLGAFDYDLDGHCDLYVVQSGGNPRAVDSSAPNELYRNLDGKSFSEVSESTQTQDRGYGQGVCAADLNQDGWLDLVIANIGLNAVYFNQGDGTFRRANDEYWSGDPAAWTSSIAVGDLDGDQLPEVIEVNYLDDPQIFERKCVGKQLDCTPQRFRAAVDGFFRTQEDGSLVAWDGAVDSGDKPNYGFGAILTNVDGLAGNDLFVSNDGDVNHLWRSLSMGAESSSHLSPEFRMSETGALSGCSIGVNGLSQACMGIASGDFDRNGTFDFLITNFHNEPLNLFLQMSPGLFVDEALKYGLAQSAKDVLGFGVQSIDFDHDGWLDVAVSNGHLYDARYADIPFQMQSQLFRGSKQGFRLQDSKLAGDYWSRSHLARTLATFDFNRDGRMDLIASHLDQPIAVLRNDSGVGNWLQLDLIGVKSERDAIGAKVIIHCQGESWTSWVVSGDGYMCTNQAGLHFGIGDHQKIERVEVQWPSGEQQVFESLKANQRVLIVEGFSPHHES